MKRIMGPIIITLVMMLGAGCGKSTITRAATMENPEGSVIPVSQELYHAGNCAQTSQSGTVDPRCLVY